MGRARLPAKTESQSTLTQIDFVTLFQQRAFDGADDSEEYEEVDNVNERRTEIADSRKRRRDAGSDGDREHGGGGKKRRASPDNRRQSTLTQIDFFSVLCEIPPSDDDEMEEDLYLDREGKDPPPARELEVADSQASDAGSQDGLVIWEDQDRMDKSGEIQDSESPTLTQSEAEDMPAPIAADAALSQPEPPSTSETDSQISSFPVLQHNRPPSATVKVESFSSNSRSQSRRTAITGSQVESSPTLAPICTPTKRLERLRAANRAALCELDVNVVEIPGSPQKDFTPTTARRLHSGRKKVKSPCTRKGPVQLHSPRPRTGFSRVRSFVADSENECSENEELVLKSPLRERELCVVPLESPADVQTCLHAGQEEFEESQIPLTDASPQHTYRTDDMTQLPPLPPYMLMPFKLSADTGAVSQETASGITQDTAMLPPANRRHSSRQQQTSPVQATTARIMPQSPELSRHQNASKATESPGRDMEPPSSTCGSASDSQSRRAMPTLSQLLPESLLRNSIPSFPSWLYQRRQ